MINQAARIERPAVLALTGLIGATGVGERALAFDRTWNGNNGLWSETFNWTPSAVPGIGDTAIFDALIGYNVLLNGDHTVDEIDFQQGAGSFFSINGGPWTLRMMATGGLSVDAGVMIASGVDLDVDVNATVSSDLQVIGSDMTVGNQLGVGFNGFTGITQVTNGSLTTDLLSLGQNGGSGTLNVSGASATLDVLTKMFVAASGPFTSAGFCTIGGGATAAVRELAIQIGVTTPTQGDVTVTGAGSSLEVLFPTAGIGNPDNLGTGTLRVADDATLTLNGILVLDSGTLALDSGTLEANSFINIDGGTFTRAAGTTYTQPGSTFTLNVRNEGTMDWDVSTAFGGTSVPGVTWNIETGGFVELPFSLRIGSGAGLRGFATVDSDFGLSPLRSTLRSAGGGAGADLTVGDFGLGELDVTAGSLVSFGDDCVIADEIDSEGTVTVDGVEGGFRSTLDLTRAGTGAWLNVGRFGNGTCSVLNGALVQVGQCYVGQLAGANGLLTVGGAQGGEDATLALSGGLYIGGTTSTEGGSALVNVLDDGIIDVNSNIVIWPAEDLQIDNGGAVAAGGTLTCRGGVLIDIDGRLDVSTNALITGEGGTLNDVNVGATINPQPTRKALPDTPTTPQRRLGLAEFFVGDTLYVGGDAAGPIAPASIFIHDLGLVEARNITNWVGGTIEQSTAGEINIENVLTNDGAFHAGGIIFDISAGPPVAATIQNNGELHVGLFGVGQLEVDGFETQLNLNSAGTMLVELGGHGFFDYDRINGSSKLFVTLGGTLDISFVNGFEPSVGDGFIIVSAAPLVLGVPLITGQFDQVAGPPGYTFEVQVSDEVVALVVTDIPCAADTNGDDHINTDDFLAVLANWGACPDPCPPTCTGDTNNDCQVNTDDFLAVLSDWGPCAAQ